MRYSLKTKTIHLNVRQLARSPYAVTGSLHGGLDAKAAIGRQVHAEVTAGATLQEETIQHDIDYEGWTVRIQGRIDGIVIANDAWTVREIKTRFEPWREKLPPPRENDVRQLEVYLALLRLQNADLMLLGELVEVYVASGRQRIHPVPVPDIDDWISRMVRPWVLWAESIAGQKERRKKLQIEFPHENPRLAQKEIAKAVNDSYDQQVPLMLSAPTGSGKTAAVLTEALRLAVPSGRQVLWLTAKTPQQALPMSLCRHLSKDLRMAQVSSKQRVCLNEVLLCHPQACTFLRDEPRKMVAAWPDLVKQPKWVTRTAKKVGREHEICPHLLGKRQVDIADIVIADLNYGFDPDCVLTQVFDRQRADNWILVVDEAHNLAERAREYFTATLPQPDDPRINLVVMGRLGQTLEKMVACIKRVQEAYALRLGKDELLPVVMLPKDAEELGELAFEVSLESLMAVEDLPLEIIQGILNTADEVRRFSRLVVERTNDRQQTVVTRAPEPTLKTICLDAGDWLGERYQLFHHAIFMSATLHPTDYFQQLFGMEDALARTIGDDHADSNRQVLLVPSISTIYRDRQASMPKLTALLKEIGEACPGRSAVFFPSFAYLKAAHKSMQVDWPIIVQESGMTVADVKQLVATFQSHDKAMFLAVTSGLLGEGVDFGDGGIEALAIVGPALPGMSGEADLRRKRYDDLGQDGFLWTYACPGMQRVIQAAGRLIRRPEDRGQIILLGQRFRRAPYRFLIPPDWEPTMTPRPGQAITEFWRGKS